MKGGYRRQSFKVMAKPSPTPPSLQSKSRGTPFKSEMNRNLVDLWISMLEKDIDAIPKEDDGNSGAEEHEKTIPEGCQQFEGLDKFSILVDGSVPLDAKLLDNTRRKYYDLCASQNSVLHEEHLPGLNCTLVVGMIKETVNISEAIRAEVPQSDLVAWDRTMQSFQIVGMNVGFIREQIHELLGRTLERGEAAALEGEAESEIAGGKMKALCKGKNPLTIIDDGGDRGFQPMKPTTKYQMKGWGGSPLR